MTHGLQIDQWLQIDKWLKKMTNDLQIDQKKWLVATKKVTKWTTDWQKKVTSELQIDKWLMNLQIDKKSD